MGEYSAEEDAAIKAMALVCKDWNVIAQAYKKLFGNARTKDALYKHFTRALKAQMPAGWDQA